MLFYLDKSHDTSNLISSNTSQNIKKKESKLSGIFQNSSKFGLSSFLKNSRSIKSETRAANTETNENPAREQWTRKTEFLLAIIGFSVDLGNIWRCKNITRFILLCFKIRRIIKMRKFLFKK